MSMFDKRKDSDTPQRSSAPEPPPPPPAPRTRTPETVSVAREIASIGKTITINGDVTGEESLIVEGKVNGTVTLKKNDLTVGQSGHVTADVTANVVRVEGEVTGDIDGVEKVVITKTGRVLGNVVAPRVTLEDGAKFKGSIDMDPEHPAKPAAAAPAPAQPLRSVPSAQPTPGTDRPRDDGHKA